MVFIWLQLFTELSCKLLAGVFVHILQEELYEKYNTDFCMFEATSLYGSTKQYHNMMAKHYDSQV